MLFKQYTQLNFVILLALLQLSVGCTDSIGTENLDITKAFIAVPLASPVPNNALEQRVTSRPNGDIVVLWWQNLAIDKRLLVSTQVEGSWTSPGLVTDRANVVDAQIETIGNEALAALWLVSSPTKNGDGEVQDVYIARGNGDGTHWGLPYKLNQGAMTSNKVSPVLTAMADGSLLATWIDLSSASEQADASTSLMVARIAKDNTLIQVTSVDKAFCTCCGPALVSEGQDGFLSYRDLQGDNIRDIAFIKLSKDSFSQSAIVHKDNWKIDGCPSSGPTIAHSEQTVVIAWLTSVKDRLVIRVAFSHDNGSHFAAPIDLENNVNSIAGIAMDSPHSALVAWTASGKQGEIIKLARVLDEGRMTHRTHVLELSDGKSFKWPGPRMTKTDNFLVIAWNDEQSKKLGLMKVEVTQ